MAAGDVTLIAKESSVQAAITNTNTLITDLGTAQTTLENKSDALNLVPQQLLNTSLSVTTSETDLVNITGRGLLNEVSLGFSTPTNIVLRVYIDGILKWNGRTNNGGNNNICGIFKRFYQAYGGYLENLLTTPAYQYIQQTPLSVTMRAYPFTGTISGGDVTVIDSKIPYNQSLRITAQALTDTATSSVFAEYSVLA
ncbi:hypothetical protein [Dehalobacter restrictus]|uniref:Tail fiber protein n=1 Tax=Dehalobacter restrictus TaxID=55583 RepID=A0A857DFW7_9FIRM|nr:hypothetical protein [Dehalobacter restrictus]QGZ99438.1 hypothetical protein GQ588_01530 [Dehalobacter restrictus]